MAPALTRKVHGANGLQCFCFRGVFSHQFVNHVNRFIFNNYVRECKRVVATNATSCSLRQAASPRANEHFVV